MNSKLKLATTAAIAAFLLGCASVGNNFDESKVTQIQKGVTTEADLVASFGQPAQRSMNSEGQTILVWTYHESEVKAESFIPYVGPITGGDRSRNKTLTVTLTDGKVASYNYSGGGLETRGTKQEVPKK